MRALSNPRVGRWVCVEPDPRLAGRLASAKFALGVDPEVLVGNLRDVPTSDRFDTIVYIDVLEHIASDHDELVGAAALLSPGGHLVVLSPAFQWLFSEFDAALGHERRYDKRTLSAAFPPELERVRLFYADTLGMMLSLANRLMLRQSLPSRSQIRFWDRVVIPVSTFLDPLLGRSFGRSIIAIYRKPTGK